MGYYENATICINGHVASSDTANYRKHCKQCGQETISVCQKCDSSIQGYYFVPGIIGFSDYNRPSYCHDCGSPYPWTEQLINNAIELISLDEELPSDIKDVIKSSLPDLIVETPSAPLAVAKYRKYMSQANDYTRDGIKNLLIDIVSETIKKSLWG